MNSNIKNKIVFIIFIAFLMLSLFNIKVYATEEKFSLLISGQNFWISRVAMGTNQKYATERS